PKIPNESSPIAIPSITPRSRRTAFVLRSSAVAFRAATAAIGAKKGSGWFAIRLAMYQAIVAAAVRWTSGKRSGASLRHARRAAPDMRSRASLAAGSRGTDLTGRGVERLLQDDLSPGPSERTALVRH